MNPGLPIGRIGATLPHVCQGGRHDRSSHQHIRARSRRGADARAHIRPAVQPGCAARLGVLGILAVNAITFAMPEPVMMNPSLQPGGLEGEAAAAWQTMHVFFQDKLRTLFSMLFGASIFLIGGERSDLTRGKLLRKRLFWLGLFGLVARPVLLVRRHPAALRLTGLLVLLVRSWSAKRLSDRRRRAQPGPVRRSTSASWP